MFNRKSNNGNKALTIEDVTGSKNKVVQAQAYIKVVTAPVIELIVRWDGRTGVVSVASIGNISPTDAVELLEKGVHAIHQQIERDLAPAETDTNQTK
jgi:hypothetical protein